MWMNVHTGDGSFLKPRGTDPLSGELSINWEYTGEDDVCVLFRG